MSDTNWIPVSPDAPCPICGKADWCRVSPDGQIAACRRENRGGKAAHYRDGTTAFVHRLNSAVPVSNGKAAHGTRPKSVQFATADTQTRDRVYRQLMDKLTLSQEHKANLRSRGLTIEQIELRGYRTWSQSILVTLDMWNTLGHEVFGTIPGFGPECRIHAPSGLLIPCRTMAGQVIALKVRRDAVRGNQKRYSYLSSHWHGHEGPGPGSPCHVPAGITSPVGRVRITEGELKADVATALSEIPTISFPGAQSWRKAVDTAKAMGAKTIVVAFDADATTNRVVAECLVQCVQAVLGDGLGVDLETWDLQQGKGIDDLLAAGKSPVVNSGKQALVEAKRILDASQTAAAKPIEADDDPHRLARVNLARYTTHIAGATIRYWRDEWYTWKPSRGCYRKIGVEELRAKITASVKSEFDRINLEKQKNPDNDAVPKSQKVTKTLVTNVLDATKSDCIVPSSVEMMTWLDGKERHRKNYVAMTNGILDLDRLLTDESAELSDVLLPHSPQWFSTVRLPYSFDPNATCPRWEKFLERNLEMDPERIKILQEWAGYLLLPETGQQRFLALEGEGANGKSVYCAAITAMLGLENCSHVSVEQLGDKFVRTQTLGRLVNICPDVGEIDKANEGDLKSFVSGDVMFFDRKHLAGLNCTPTARLMMSFNNRPRFSDRSMGIWRRMLLIPFNVQIQESERVQNMDKHRWWEASGELPGILLWAIAGLHRLRRQGRFTSSSLSSEAIEDYRSESNPARAFLIENLEVSPGSKVRTTDVYRFYKAWAEANGYRALGERAFGKEIVRVFSSATRKFSGTRGNRHWCYENVTFSQDEICGQSTDDALLF